MRGLHAFGVDDDTVHTLALRQILFLVWVTFAEHKWVILGERRRAGLTKSSVALHPTDFRTPTPALGRCGERGRNSLHAPAGYVPTRIPTPREPLCAPLSTPRLESLRARLSTNPRRFWRSNFFASTASQHNTTTSYLINLTDA